MLVWLIINVILWYSTSQCSSMISNCRNSVAIQVISDVFVSLSTFIHYSLLILSLSKQLINNFEHFLWQDNRNRVRFIRVSLLTLYQIKWFNWFTTRVSNSKYVCSNLTFIHVYLSFRLVRTPTIMIWTKSTFNRLYVAT